jgi:hypothetical protein
MADTGYDSNRLRGNIAAKGAMAVVPNNPSRVRKYPLDKHLRGGLETLDSRLSGVCA